MHVHLSALDAFIQLLYLLILGFMIRFVTVKNKDNQLGKALAFIY